MCRWSYATWREGGGSGFNLHADDARTRDCDARLRPDWGCAFCDLWWIFKRGDCRPQSRCKGRGRDHSRWRLAARSSTTAQEKRRRGSQQACDRRAPDREACHCAQAYGPASGDGAWPRCVVARSGGWDAHRHSAGGNGFRGPALYFVYQRFDWKTKGHQAHDRRLSRVGQDHGRVGV